VPKCPTLHMQEFMSKWGRSEDAEADEEASQASGKAPQPYLSMPSTLPEIKEREGGAFQESSPAQGYGGETDIYAKHQRIFTGKDKPHLTAALFRS